MELFHAKDYTTRLAGVHTRVITESEESDKLHRMLRLADTSWLLAVVTVRLLS